MSHPSLDVMEQLIEQTMAAGHFKRLQDLDFVRGHLTRLNNHILNLENTLEDAIKRAADAKQRLEDQEEKSTTLD
jgi:hypothetical protein